MYIYVCTYIYDLCSASSMSPPTIFKKLHIAMHLNTLHYDILKHTALHRNTHNTLQYCSSTIFK